MLYNIIDSLLFIVFYEYFYRFFKRFKTLIQRNNICSISPCSSIIFILNSNVGNTQNIILFYKVVLFRIDRK
jgi:hypothetical protein